jgi:hypothetical protein
MGFSNLLNVLDQYRNASPTNPPANVHQDYEKVAQNAPQGSLAGGLSAAFNSDQTPPFGQMLGTLFSNSDPQQRAGILNQLISSAGPSLLASGALGGLSGMLRGGQVTPEQAQQVPPEAVQQMAEHAQRQNPSIVDQASQFYAQHPKLVQSLGAASLALIMSHLSQRSRG